MRLTKVLPYALAAATMVAIPTHASAAGRIGFGFNSAAVGGAVTLSGGGSWTPGQPEISAGGGFRCVDDVTRGPLDGCLQGEGVRWDAVNLLPSTRFACGVGDAGKTIATDAHTAVLVADFYRAGDGNTESFTAEMIVADHDIAPDVDGIQNVWVKLVGCAPATVHFNNK